MEGDDSHLTVKDAAGNKRNVLKNGGLYNLMAREYQYNTADCGFSFGDYTTSYAVVHQLNGPLMWEKDDEAENME